MAHWAIAIGINAYENLRSLKYAQRDAEAFASFVLSDLKSPSDRVSLFTDNSPEVTQTSGDPLNTRPTFRRLRWILQNWFEEAFLSESDTLWFFFAGHGLRHHGQDCLMPADADIRDIDYSSIPVNHITSRLRRSGAGNIVLLLDACRSEDGDRRDGRGVGDEVHQGVVTFYSCRPDSSSYEIDDLGHGSFTYALLEGLRAKGAENSATVKRLETYLQARVPELNRENDKPDDQIPYARAEPTSRVQMVLHPEYASQDDVRTLMNEAYKTYIQNNKVLARQYCFQVIEVSRTTPGENNDAFQDAISLIEEIARESTLQIRYVPPFKPVSIRQVEAASNSENADKSTLSCEVSIQRIPQRSGVKFDIYCDGYWEGNLANGETREFRVSPGMHKIKVAFRSYREPSFNRYDTGSSSWGESNILAHNFDEAKNLVLKCYFLPFWKIRSFKELGGFRRISLETVEIK